MAGKQVVFVTNNSTKSRADYKKKLETMGVPAKVVSSTDSVVGTERLESPVELPFPSM